MSGNWNFYFCDMGGHTASIYFDDGLSDGVDALPLTHALRVRAPLKEMRNGLTTDAEAERLFEVEDLIVSELDALGGIFVGRITSNGRRIFNALIPEQHQALSERLATIGQKTGYDLAVAIEADPEKRVYWQDLYPNEDDRRVMLDMRVLEHLREHGDIHDTERAIDHMSYFKTRADADAYTAWLEDNGYTNISVVTDAQGPEIGVECQHFGSAGLDEITSHTLALSRKARELGGEYDGWVSPVIRSPKKTLWQKLRGIFS